jgi:DNA-binding PadR family transcriptional regulator
MREREEHYYKRHMHGRHLLQPALLLMVHMGPTHGYDLMERLEKIGLGDIDPSMIYRALHALEAEGMVTSIWKRKKARVRRAVSTPSLLSVKKRCRTSLKS